MKSIGESLRDARQTLQQAGIETVRSDADWLLSGRLNVSISDLYVHADRILADEQVADIVACVQRRCQREPVQYIIGHTEFRGIKILVGPEVLVPRPETERLVDLALGKYSARGDILDLCTGSGAILFSLAGELSPCPRLYGTDLSADALTWAWRNFAVHATADITFFQGDLFEPVTKRLFEIVVANPPYVAANEFDVLPPDVREFEPRIALHAEENGLAVLRRIATNAGTYLMDGGWLICEIGECQGQAVTTIFRNHGWTNIAVELDDNGKDRFVLGQKRVVS